MFHLCVLTHSRHSLHDGQMTDHTMLDPPRSSHLLKYVHIVYIYNLYY